MICMIKYPIFIILLISLMAVPSFAQLTNPYTTDYLLAEVVQTGTIQTTGRVEDMTLILSIPQEDNYQTVEKIEVDKDYTIYNDSLGNKYVRIRWNDPQETNKFTVKTLVLVKRRGTSEVRKISDFIQPTQLIDSEDSNIASLAATFKGNNFERISSATKWVADNIEYDMQYSTVNKSATWTLANKKGVCDEFTTLLIALTRNMGYYSSYIAGYAYSKNGDSKEGFIAHGWAEVNDMPVDPTWSQAGFVDATHIKFAELADASYTQASINANGLGKFTIDLNEMRTDISVIEEKDSSLIQANSTLLDDMIYSGYAVIKTDVSANGCYLTKEKIQSCINGEGEDLLDVLEEEKTYYFCNKASVFSIMKLNDNSIGSSLYKCPINVLQYANGVETVPLRVSFESPRSVELTISKTILYPGEEYEVESAESHIFTDNGDYAFGSGKFYAPNSDFTIYSYDSGTLVSKRMQIVSSKSFDAYMTVGNSVQVHVENLLDRPQNITVTVGDETLEKVVDDSQTFVFSRKPGAFQAEVRSSEFSMILNENIKPNEVNIFTQIIDFFRNLFSGLFR
ncbi:MAG: transglutaminase family protein [Candidatus Aenigmarchaeota archaeon]|nr:transglutaminase family protein [Candidatus Aenigmarchaeota archaeon]